MENRPRFEQEILQCMQPVYVINERTKEIVFANEYLIKAVGRDITGELCYRALASKEAPCRRCPMCGRPGDRYVWEYFCASGNCSCGICNYWTEKEGELYRIGIVEDSSDALGLSRYAVNYLSLMTGLSEMQADIIKNQDKMFQIILRFLKKRFQGKEVVVTFPKEDHFKLFWLDENDIMKEKTITGNEPELAYLLKCRPETVEVLENIYEFRIIMKEKPIGFEEDKNIVFDVIKLYLENAVFKEEIDWEIKHDRGTKLYNRAHFMQQAKFCYRRLRTIGVIYLDIDNLKKVNDRQGHAAGDILIGKAAQVLGEISSDHIHTYRMGGDEFVVVLCNCNKEDLSCAAENIRKKTEECNQRIPDPKLRLSMGAAFGSGDFSVEELVKKADSGMYEDKRKRKAERDADETV